MSSLRRVRRRHARWVNYMERISRSSVRHHDYPFGLSVKTTPGYFAPRRIMTYRGRDWYVTTRRLDELFRDGDLTAMTTGSNPSQVEGGGA